MHWLSDLNEALESLDGEDLLAGLSIAAFVFILLAWCGVFAMGGLN